MAFKMNRPVIKGTALHKASVAKATSQSIVSQRRTRSDASLVSAAEALGQSYTPQAIDFSIKMPEINIPEKQELTEAEKEARENKRQERKDKRAEKKDKRARERADKKAKKLSDEFDGYVNYMEGQRLDNQIINEDDWLALSKRERKNLTKNVKSVDFKTKVKRRKDKVEEDIQSKARKARRTIEKGLGIADRIGKFFRNTAGQIVNTADSLISGTVNAAGQIIDEAGNVVGEVLRGVDAGLGKVTSDVSKGIEGLEQTIEAERNKIKAAYDKKVRLMKEKKLSRQQEKERIARWEAEMKRDIAIMNQQVKEKKGGIAVDEKLRSDENRSYGEDPSKKDESGKSPADMRDDRIYRNAIKGGPVRKNMIKGGYIPPSKR